MEVKAPYIPFLQWLQNKHPDLYIRCLEAISVEDKRIFINEKVLSGEDYKLLLLAVEEYYGIAA